jgi:hypothetical protein
MISVVLRGQSGALSFYSYASALLLAGLLAVIVLGFRRLAAVLPIVIMLMFLVSTRSQAEYFLIFIPVWLVWSAGTDRVSVEAPRAVATGRFARLVRTRARRVGLAVACLVPAMASVAVAVLVPSPLSLRVLSAQLTGTRVSEVRVDVVNRTDRRVTPHFYVDQPSHIHSPWRIDAGPSVVPAHGHAVVLLRPGFLGAETPVAGLRVWALSDGPATLSSTRLVLR